MELFENFTQNENENYLEEKIDKKLEWTLMNEFLKNIKACNFSFYKEMEKKYGEEEIKNIWKRISFLILKNVSSVVKETIDFEKAKQQGRKKGDGKGKWPTKIENIKYITPSFTYLTNLLVNRNFWETANFCDIQYKLLCLVAYITYSNFEHMLSGEETFSPIYAKSKKKERKNINSEIENYINEKFVNLNNKEKELLLGIIEKNDRLRKSIENAIEKNI